jgi:hypothetical protein
VPVEAEEIVGPDGEVRVEGPGCMYLPPETVRPGVQLPILVCRNEVEVDVAWVHRHT